MTRRLDVMGDAYNRPFYQRPQRQEWMSSPPQYFSPQGMDPFGMSAGGYMGPGMGPPPVSMGPPMPLGAFQPHQPAGFHLPPPGAIPTSNLTYPVPTSITGSRGPILPAPIHPYSNQQGSGFLSSSQGLVSKLSNFPICALV